MQYGDVVIHKDKHYVNLGIIKNNEDAGSCSYDRTYLLFSLPDKVERLVGSEVDTIQVHVTGTSLPFKETDWIPYNVYHENKRHYVNGSLSKTEDEYIIKQKLPKIVYE